MALRFLALLFTVVFCFPLAAQVNRLTPGKLSTTTFPEVLAPTLFSGVNGFFVDVPVDAVSIRIDLSTAPRDANINLYARFGVDVQQTADGEILADFRSEDPGGSESLTIGADTMPALRPG